MIEDREIERERQGGKTHEKINSVYPIVGSARIT
jgi:hypothetical protein